MKNFIETFNNTNIVIADETLPQGIFMGGEQTSEETLPKGGFRASEGIEEGIL